MTTQSMNPMEALRLALNLIGLAKIGIPPSARLAKIAHDSIAEMKNGDKPAFPNATARLADIALPLLPAQAACKKACDELILVVRQHQQDLRHSPNLRPTMS